MTQEKTQTAAPAAKAADAPAKKHRLLKISILRYNPQDPDSVPHMQTYELQESDSMTLFIALNDLRASGLCFLCGRASGILFVFHRRGRNKAFLLRELLRRLVLFLERLLEG